MYMYVSEDWIDLSASTDYIVHVMYWLGSTTKNLNFVVLSRRRGGAGRSPMHWKHDLYEEDNQSPEPEESLEHKQLK